MKQGRGKSWGGEGGRGKGKIEKRMGKEEGCSIDHVGKVRLNSI